MIPPHPHYPPRRPRGTVNTPPLQARLTQYWVIAVSCFNQGSKNSLVGQIQAMWIFPWQLQYFFKLEIIYFVSSDFWKEKNMSPSLKGPLLHHLYYKAKRRKTENFNHFHVKWCIRQKASWISDSASEKAQIYLWSSFCLQVSHLLINI